LCPTRWRSVSPNRGIHRLILHQLPSSVPIESHRLPVK